MSSDEQDRTDEQTAEHPPGVPGAEGGSDSKSADVPPGLPADDDSPLGDTDQHSNA